MQGYLAARLASGEDLVNAVGVRAEESEARSRLLEWEWQEGFDCEVWRPLLAWTEQQVIEIHRRHGLEPNPLYLLGASRVGCWPCIHARKAEIRLVAELTPRRIDEIRQLEKDLTAELKTRVSARGEEQRWGELTFFQGASSASREDGQTWPIDKTVAWSRTSRGGRQMEFFLSPSDGCVRWGLCEGTAATTAG